MSERRPSRTALGVAMLRAAHQLLDDRPLILDDPIALRLLGAQFRVRLEQDLASVQAPLARALRSHVVVRSRFAEDRLMTAVARGARQHVVLGAGYDTFAYRQPPWANNLRIFEVDQGDTQQDKRDRLARAGVLEPANLTFVDVDFRHDLLEDALARASFDRAQPAFLSWLGVSMYLDAQANDGVFRFAAALAPTSELVFTFAPADREGTSILAERAAVGGEPWISFFEPDALADQLKALGFTSAWIPTTDEIAAAYFAGRTDALPAPQRRTIALAVV